MRSLFDPLDGFDFFDFNRFGEMLLAMPHAPALASSGSPAGSTASFGRVTASPAVAAKAVSAIPAIAVAAPSVLAAAGQDIAFSRLFTIGSSAANPAYLIVTGLDRNEYTAGVNPSGMGQLAGGTATQGFTNAGGDSWTASVVFTYQPSTGQYVNTRFGNLSQLAFDTGTNRGDTATLSVFGTNNAGLANSYASNPYVLVSNPAYFTDYGSVAVLTGATAPTSAGVTATASGIAAAALSYVGNTWNDEGCWVLASDIAAKAGATLPLTSTLTGVAGVANGEWFVAYNGPVSANSNWVSTLTAGEMVSFQTTSGGGHITTVVSGQGASSQLVDNITYIDGSGNILDSAHDGSANDIVVQAPHAAMQEFSGVNAATVVVYELDAPIVTDVVASVAAATGASIALGADFTARDPKAGQAVTQYQVYETNAADTLTVSGAANHSATSASTACTVSSLAGLGLTASVAGTDTVEVRASNGSYWGDWTALTVTVASPVTAASALASTGTAPVAVADTAANISAAADKLQSLASSGRLSSLSVTGGGKVALSAAQLGSDHGVVSLLPAGALQVTGASANQAAALQGNGQVASFTVSDTAANLTAVHAALGGDSKLASVTVTGTSGTDTLDLSGVHCAASINLSGNAATSPSGLSAATLAFLPAADSITLGSGAATITAGLAGITAIGNFQFGLDTLQLTLGTASSMSVFDVSYNGAHAIAVTGGSDTGGVVLVNQPTSVTAASVLSGMNKLNP